MRKGDRFAAEHTDQAGTGRMRCNAGAGHERCEICAKAVADEQICDRGISAESRSQLDTPIANVAVMRDIHLLPL